MFGLGGEALNEGLLKERRDMENGAEDHGTCVAGWSCRGEDLVGGGDRLEGGPLWDFDLGGRGEKIGRELESTCLARETHHANNGLGRVGERSSNRGYVVEDLDFVRDWGQAKGKEAWLLLDVLFALVFGESVDREVDDGFGLGVEVFVVWVVGEYLFPVGVLHDCNV